MADEPVSAWAEPWTRKLLRWLTRHRTGVTGAAAAVLAGVVGLSAVLAVQARANLALADKNTALTAANARVTEANTDLSAAKAEADQSAAESKAVVDFMVNGALGAAAPSSTKGEAITVLQALEKADKEVAGQFEKEPRVEAAVRMALSSVYSELGEYERSGGHAERALDLLEKVSVPSMS